MNPELAANSSFHGIESIDGPIPYPKLYLQFFEEFNSREYFEAHEVLEDLWIMETSEYRNYYKGMIMITIALEHWSRGNLPGAYRLYRDSLCYLQPYPEIVLGFELAEFLRKMSGLFSKIVESRGTSADEFSYDNHPTLKLLQTAE